MCMPLKVQWVLCRQIHFCVDHLQLFPEHLSDLCMQLLMVNIYIIKLPPFYPLSFTLAPYLKFFTVAKMFEPKAFYLKSFFSPYLVYLIFQPVFKIQLVALILKTDVAVIKEPVLHEVSYRPTELCFQSWDLLFIYRLCPLLFA